MDRVRIIGAILVIAGIAALSYGGFTYTKETHEADLGPLEIRVKDKERVNIPGWAGGALVAGGLAVMLLGKKILAPRVG